LISLLPIYAKQLGTKSTTAGLYLAFSYLANALKTVFAGLIFASCVRRKLPLVAAGLAGSPLAWLMGQVTSL
jgi:hypothetical protein